MENHISLNKKNSQDSLALDKANEEYISSLYAAAKSIYKNAEHTGNTDDAGEAELLRIQSKFHARGDKKGVLFCKKAMAIVYEKRGDTALDTQKKIDYYEIAHDKINETLIQAQQLRWEQPSLLKRQGIIKSKLGEALHHVDDHYNAHILESDGFRIFGKMLKENPGYAEGHLEKATASFNKVKWSLRKILNELSKAEQLFAHPKHTRHRPDDTELNEYKNRIEEMRNTANLILAYTN
jgi:hypothetical protein